jgi:hypothetical protein
VHAQTFSILNNAARFLWWIPKININGELKVLCHGQNSGIPNPVLVHPILVPVKKSIRICELYAVK